jgi:hypothetical protein
MGDGGREEDIVVMVMGILCVAGNWNINERRVQLACQIRGGGDNKKTREITVAQGLNITASSFSVLVVVYAARLKVD